MRKGDVILFRSIILIVGFVFLLNSVLVSGVSSLGTFKQSDCVSLYQLCDTCTFVNITNVKVDGENNTIFTINQEMQRSGEDYNFSFCNTSFVGEYSYSVCGDKEGTLTCEVIDFRVTKKGSTLETSESLIYILLTIVVGLFLLISLYFAIVMPYKNTTNEKGAVIKIVKLKYVKIGLVLLTHVLLTWLLNLLIGISDNFVSLRMYYGFISFLFTTLMNLSIPLSLGLLILALFEIIRDSNIQNAISKFGSA